MDTNLYKFPVSDINQVSKTAHELETRRKTLGALANEEQDWLDWALLQLTENEKKQYNG